MNIVRFGLSKKHFYHKSYQFGIFSQVALYGIKLYVLISVDNFIKYKKKMFSLIFHIRSRAYWVFYMVRNNEYYEFPNYCWKYNLYCHLQGNRYLGNIRIKK